MKFYLPIELVTDKLPRSFWGRMRGYDLKLRDDIAVWCMENRVRPGNIAPRMVTPFGSIGPYRITIRNSKKAILFKMRWF